jgi:hypothetical protein
MTAPWIQTRAQLALDILDPKPEQVTLEDVAFSLAHLNRFNGHAGTYSVAEHSVHVSRAVPERLARAALLHDVAEYVTGDMSSPMKRAMWEILSGFSDRDRGPGADNDPFAEITRRIDVACCLRFDVPHESLHDPIVKNADLRVLEAERRRFFPVEARPWELGVEPATCEWLDKSDPAWIQTETVPYGARAMEMFLQRARELWIR